MVSFDPTRLDLAPYGFACKRWAPAVMRRADRHNEVEFNFLKEGWLTYLLGGKLVRIEPLQFTAFWAAVPHQIVDHGPQEDYYVLTIPLGWFLSLRLPEAFVQALTQGDVVTSETPKMGALQLARLEDWEQDFEAPESKDQKATLLEIEALIRRLAAPHADNAPSPLPQAKRNAFLHDGLLLKAERMAHMVANGYSQQLDPSQVSRELGLVQAKSTKLFQQVFGTSFSSFITAYRIFQAQRMLVTTSQRVVDISEACGFGSLGRFNRAFRLHCGVPPREYRRRSFLNQMQALRIDDSLKKRPLFPK